MNKSAKFALIVLLYIISYNNVFAGDWITVGGNNQRNGLSNEIGPSTPNVRWNKPSLFSIWGNQVYIYGDKLVTTRYLSLSPIRAPLACHSLLTGDTLWTRNYAENGVMIVMGFRDNKIYARNFQQQGFDTIYAINPVNGVVIWKSRFTVERGIIWSAAFADNGDLLLPGSANRSVMRINHLNGDTVWTRSRTIPNTGAETMCVYGNSLYTWEGGITTPKRIMAINISDGVIKYYSATLPGDGDQEIPFSIGPEGNIYLVRDGGSLHALRDNGSGFTQLWQQGVTGGVGTYSQFGIAIDSSLYVPIGRKIYKVDHLNGQRTDSTEELVTNGTLNARMAIGVDGRVYASNGASDPSQGKNFSFTQNLQTLWSIPLPYNYYSGPALGPNGILVFCGQGDNITAYQNPVSISNNSILSPEGFALFQNYPNPFNPTTRINYQIPVSNYVNLKVYDILGNEVAVLVNEKQNAGSYEVEFNARLPASTGLHGQGDNISSGIYFYKLSTEGYTDTKRMILIK